VKITIHAMLTSGDVFTTLPTESTDDEHAALVALINEILSSKPTDGAYLSLEIDEGDTVIIPAREVRFVRIRRGPS
jgi:hypothetical protein